MKRRKTNGKTKTEINYKVAIDQIRPACELCTPGTDEMFVEWEQHKYEKVLSRHMLQVHGIKDPYLKQLEDLTRRRKKYKLPNFVVEGQSWK